DVVTVQPFASVEELVQLEQILAAQFPPRRARTQSGAEARFEENRSLIASGRTKRQDCRRSTGVLSFGWLPPRRSGGSALQLRTIAHRTPATLHFLPPFLDLGRIGCR